MAQAKPTKAGKPSGQRRSLEKSSSPPKTRSGGRGVTKSTAKQASETAPRPILRLRGQHASSQRAEDNSSDRPLRSSGRVTASNPVLNENGIGDPLRYRVRDVQALLAREYHLPSPGWQVEGFIVRRYTNDRTTNINVTDAVATAESLVHLSINPLIAIVHWLRRYWRNTEEITVENLEHMGINTRERLYRAPFDIARALHLDARGEHETSIRLNPDQANIRGQLLYAGILEELENYELHGCTIEDFPYEDVEIFFDGRSGGVDSIEGLRVVAQRVLLAQFGQLPDMINQDEIPQSPTEPSHSMEQRNFPQGHVLGNRSQPQSQILRGITPPERETVVRFIDDNASQPFMRRRSAQDPRMSLENLLNSDTSRGSTHSPPARPRRAAPERLSDERSQSVGPMHPQYPAGNSSIRRSTTHSSSTSSESEQTTENDGSPEFEEFCHPCPFFKGEYHHCCTGHRCPGMISRTVYPSVDSNSSPIPRQVSGRHDGSTNSGEYQDRPIRTPPRLGSPFNPRRSQDPEYRDALRKRYRRKQHKRYSSADRRARIAELTALDGEDEDVVETIEDNGDRRQSESSDESDSACERYPTESTDAWDPPFTNSRASGPRRSLKTLRGNPRNSRSVEQKQQPEVEGEQEPEAEEEYEPEVEEVQESEAEEDQENITPPSAGSPARHTRSRSRVGSSQRRSTRTSEGRQEQPLPAVVVEVEPVPAAATEVEPNLRTRSGRVSRRPRRFSQSSSPVNPTGASMKSSTRGAKGKGKGGKR